MKTPKPKTGYLQVYDTEKNKWVECKPEEQKTAAYVHQQILIGSFISAVAIKKIFDERLYIDLGCGSRDEYIETMLPLGRAQAYKYYAIATKLDTAFKSLSGKGVGRITQGDSRVTPLSGLNGEISSEVGELGINKYYELTRLDDKEFEKLMKKEKINLGGEVVGLGDMKGMSGREVKRIVAEHLDPYKHKLKKANDKSALDDEKIKMLEAEKKANAKKVENASELQMLHGGPANLLENKKDYLIRAQKLLNDFMVAMTSVGINPDDPESLKADFVDTIRKVDEVHQRLIHNHGDVTTEF